jgi:hypothetical protein
MANHALDCTGGETIAVAKEDTALSSFDKGSGKGGEEGDGKVSGKGGGKGDHSCSPGRGCSDDNGSGSDSCGGSCGG